MDLLRAGAFVHIVLSILLMGFALFWFFMDVALRKRHGAEPGQELLRALVAVRWPPGGLPARLRIPLPWLGVLVIAALVVTGLPGALARGATGSLWMVKLALFAAVLVIQLLMTRGMSSSLVKINFALTAAVIVVSSWTIR